MNNTPDDLGIQWFDVPSAKTPVVQSDFVSMPFTGISSPASASGLPLIKHEAGSVGRSSRSRGIQKLHTKFMDAKIQEWGPSSPYTVDLQALTSATRQLVSGVISGNIDQVRDALKNHADPAMTVAVLDPNKDSPSSYISLPLGVAALLRGNELVQQTNDKSALAPFKEIAQLLLMNGSTPNIEVGNAPDGSGSALSYKAYGVKLYGNEAGMESIETRMVNIPLSVRNLVSAAVPSAMVDNQVTPATDGMVWGEDLPAEARNNYMDLLDPQGDTLKDSIQRYRQRRSEKPSGSSPGFKM